MKRLKHLEKYGYKVVVYKSGSGCQATKHNKTVKAKSITELHRIIFGLTNGLIQ